MIPKAQDARAIPAAIGIGMRTPHFDEIIATRPAIGWLEVHAENYLGGGPAPLRLDTIRQEYPLSLHGVGLSLGSAEGLADDHLRRLRTLIARTEPFLVSEHLSWSITGDAYLNDLLPLPYTEESLDIVVANVAKAQAALGRRWAGAYSSKTRRAICATGIRRSRSLTFSASWCAAPAAACSVMSTTFSSPAAISISTLKPISRRFQPPRWARSISPGTAVSCVAATAC